MLCLNMSILKMYFGFNMDIRCFRLLICLFVYLFVCLFVRSFVCLLLFAHLLVCLFVCLIFVSGQAGFLCNNAHLRDGVLFGQPTEGALICVALKVSLA